MEDSRSRLLGRLGDGDLALLARAVEGRPAAGSLRAALRRDPASLDRLLAEPRVVEAVFSSGFSTGLSPSLVFGVVVYHAAAELERASFIMERVGPRRRLPVFDVEPVREVVAAPERRVFLVELLSSFTRVAGGVRWERTRKGLRRRRWSELDPVQVAELEKQALPWQRPALLRRLGDVSLFLIGVYPAATATRRLSPGQVARLSASAGVDPAAALEVLTGEEGTLGLFEALASRWYRRAADAAHLPVLDEMAERLPAARRFLTHVADRHLHRLEDDWLPRRAG